LFSETAFSEQVRQDGHRHRRFQFFRPLRFGRENRLRHIRLGGRRRFPHQRIQLFLHPGDRLGQSVFGFVLALLQPHQGALEHPQPPLQPLIPGRGGRRRRSGIHHLAQALCRRLCRFQDFTQTPDIFLCQRRQQFGLVCKAAAEFRAAEIGPGQKRVEAEIGVFRHQRPRFLQKNGANFHIRLTGITHVLCPPVTARMRR
jgi:hypothetical protein